MREKMLPLPRELSQNIAQIQNGYVNAQSVGYDLNLWKECFPTGSEAACISDIYSRFGGTLKRHQVGQLAVEARNGSYFEVQKLFIAAMIWGRGFVGYGPWRTKESLNSNKAQETLETTVKLISDGHIHAAYENFNLRYCGPAFFTKLFYFIGLGNMVSPLPLILDSRVVSSLRRIAAQENLDISLFSKFVVTKRNSVGSVSSYVSGYMKYIEEMHNWADQAGTKADYIEYYLFSHA
ncbi:hypothetical protein ACFLVZ_01925 [Chloroflexota bacterium]